MRDMSELQISLLAIGALVILAVFAYNKWQERKLARGAEDNFRSRHEDVLLKRPGTAALRERERTGALFYPVHSIALHSPK